MSDAARHGAELLGARLRATAQLAGGDLSTVWRIELDDGRSVVVKNGPAPRVEATMLRALHAAGAPAPAVLAVDSRVLVLARIDGNTGIASAWADLGAVLSRLHGTTGAAYGWQEDYAFGRLAIANRTHAHWPTFWAQNRLLPFLPLLPATLAQRVERLASALAERLPATPPASLLHGDLWGGNVMSARGRIAALIDPACYHGDAEVDLAMLQLFDAPDAEFFAAYGPLRAGHAERLPVYRLWPALVHFALFGDGYLRLVEAQLHDAGV